MYDTQPKDFVEEIFGRALSGRTLFRDPSVLRSEYVPPALPFRDGQIAAVAETLSPLLTGGRPSNLLLYGTTGTGKTAVAKYVLRRLTDKAAGEGLQIRASYCNTRVAKTEYRMLADLGEGLALSIPFTGLALGEVSSRILSHIAAQGHRVVFVLDEIDFLVKHFGSDLLYELTRANERLSAGFLTLVGISNDLKFKEFLDPRALSSLSEQELLFPPYRPDELRVILDARAQMAFREGAVSQAAIALCAALAGSEHGDARRAVDLLRVAGEVAEREQAQQLEEHHVRVATQRIEQDRLVEALRSLPLHVKLVLIAVLRLGPVNSTGQVYEQYVALCRRVGVPALTQRRVSGFLSELDLLGLVGESVVSAGRYGRTKRITPLITAQVAADVFRGDPTLEGLL